MNCEFPSVTLSMDDEALIVHSLEPMLAITSSITGGGILPTRYILNMHVNKNYNCNSPAEDLASFARRRGINEPFHGFITAVYLNKTRSITLREQGITVTALLTAGVSNATSAGISEPASFTPGTINIILLVDANLTPAALVNAVITATEAKTASLQEKNIRTPDGLLTTGTSTDAICIACTGRGEPTDYAGSATVVGWLMARAVRECLHEALAT
ncbi:MAG: adenosylcobinamide amidohydrolase [Anaerolineales bacterium]|nr:adenosylcobinamide amidohydrolase [Anaerolineales bacterium]